MHDGSGRLQHNWQRVAHSPHCQDFRVEGAGRPRQAAVEAGAKDALDASPSEVIDGDIGADEVNIGDPIGDDFRVVSWVHQLVWVHSYLPGGAPILRPPGYPNTERISTSVQFCTPWRNFVGPVDNDDIPLAYGLFIGLQAERLQFASPHYQSSSHLPSPYISSTPTAIHATAPRCSSLPTGSLL